MKRLLLCRHAKSSWKDPDLHDIDRPLNKRGKRNAPEMGRRLADRGIRPDLVIASPARRALNTAGLLARELGFRRKKITVRKEVYEATADGLIDLLRGLDDDAGLVMLVGHNPEITDLANTLGGLDIDNVPTCGIVALDFQAGSWRDVGRRTAALAFFDYPRRGEEEKSSSR